MYVRNVILIFNVSISCRLLEPQIIDKSKKLNAKMICTKVSGITVLVFKTTARSKSVGKFKNEQKGFVYFRFRMRYSRRVKPLKTSKLCLVALQIQVTAVVFSANHQNLQHLPLKDEDDQHLWVETFCGKLFLGKLLCQTFSRKSCYLITHVVMRIHSIVG